MHCPKFVRMFVITGILLGGLPVAAVKAQGPRREPLPGAPVAFNAPLHWGFGVGANIPFDVTEDVFTVSPSLHGALLFQAAPAIDFEADLGYWFLQAAAADAENPSLLTLTGGFRYYFNFNASVEEGPHLDAGLGLYHFSAWNQTIGGVKFSDEAENKVGFYGGLGFMHGSLDATVRVHKSRFQDEDFWNIGVVVRYFFPSSFFNPGR
jgi:hypothetical protein